MKPEQIRQIERAIHLLKEIRSTAGMIGAAFTEERVDILRDSRDAISTLERLVGRSQ